MGKNDGGANNMQIVFWITSCFFFIDTFKGLPFFFFPIMLMFHTFSNKFSVLWIQEILSPECAHKYSAPHVENLTLPKRICHEAGTSVKPCSYQTDIKHLKINVFIYRLIRSHIKIMMLLPQLLLLIDVWITLHMSQGALKYSCKNDTKPQRHNKMQLG